MMENCLLMKKISLDISGGKRKGSKIKKYCSFQELKQHVCNVAKIDSRSYDVKLVSKWVTDDGSSAIEVADDKDTNCLFSVEMRVIEIYVIKSIVETPLPTQSMATSIPSTQFEEPHCSTFPSLISNHGGGEFTNLLSRCESFVEGLSTEPHTNTK